MIVGKHTKQPTEVKDYVVDLSQWLGEAQDTLTAVQAGVVCTSRDDDPPATALAVKSVIMNPALGRVAVWLEKGTDGERYKVTVTSATAAGRVDESEFVVRIKEV